MTNWRLGRALAGVTALTALCAAWGCSPGESTSTTNAAPQDSLGAAAQTPIPAEGQPAPTFGTVAPTPDSVGATATPENAGPESQTDTRSPIDVALGAQADPEALSQAYGEAYQLFAEMATECMQAQGFDYVHTKATTPLPSEFVIGTNSDTALIAKLGYGPPRSLLGAIEARSATPPSAATTVESTWPTRGTPEWDSFLEQLAQCLDSAGAAVRLPEELPAVVGEAVQSFRASVAESEVVRTIWADWSRCMAEDGYAFTDRAAISQSLSERTLPIHQLVAGLKPTDHVPADAVETLDSVLELEAEIVVADVDCAGQTMADERLDEAYRTAELEFLQENGDWILLEMDTWRRGG